MADTKIIYALSPDVPDFDKDKNDPSKSEYESYQDFLDSAFTNPMVRNIAVTGNFGVGKSRFLRWYAKDKRFLFVSGCSFLKPDEKLPKETQDSMEDNLMSQILLGCKRGRGGILSYTWCAKALLILTLLFLLGNIFLLLVPKFSGVAVWDCVQPFCFYGLFGVLCADALFLVLRGSRFLSLKSISLEMGGAKIQMDGEKPASALDRNRNALALALADAADSIGRTVIFEDMDRLQEDCCIDLFTKLRELNHLVNLCTNEKKPIRFIYVLHDQLFSPLTERPAPEDFAQLKFFDYVLPIIPSMSRADAAVEAKRLLGVDYSVLYDIIVKLTPDLADYRLLRNIANEYHVFVEIEETRFGSRFDEIERKKTFAFCIYKNLLPDDYKKIREKQSKVFPKPDRSKLPEAICLLLDHGWLDNTCLHYVGYDRAGLKICIKDAFSAGEEAAVQKKFWLEHETELFIEVCEDSKKDTEFDVHGAELTLAELVQKGMISYELLCELNYKYENESDYKDDFDEEDDSDNVTWLLYMGLGLNPNYPAVETLEKRRQVYSSFLSNYYVKYVKLWKVIWRLIQSEDDAYDFDDEIELHRVNRDFWEIIKGFSEKEIRILDISSKSKDADQDNRHKDLYEWAKRNKWIFEEGSCLLTEYLKKEYPTLYKNDTPPPAPQSDAVQPVPQNAP